MEDRAESLIRKLLPQEWIVRKVPKDYGVDLEVEMVDKTFVTGNRVWVQSKATNRIHGRELEYDVAKWGLTPDDVPDSHDGLYRVRYFPFRIETKELDYALRCPVPLLLFLCDIGEDEVYWLPLRDEVLCSIAPAIPTWRHQGYGHCASARVEQFAMGIVPWFSGPVVVRVRTRTAKCICDSSLLLPRVPVHGKAIWV